MIEPGVELRDDDDIPKEELTVQPEDESPQDLIGDEVDDEDLADYEGDVWPKLSGGEA